MSEITEEELEKEIAKILKNADLAKTSSKTVRQKLEKVFGVDLKAKKKLIDKLVLQYVNEKEEEDEDEEEEEEEEKPKKGRKRKGDSDGDWEGSEGDSDADRKTSKKEKVAKPKKSGGRGKGGGYTRPYKLSPALADLMGKDEMPRHEVVKRMWAIVKERQLYDPNNKQFAICDDALYKVIGTKRFRVFGMMKYLKTHFLDE